MVTLVFQKIPAVAMEISSRAPTPWAPTLPPCALSFCKSGWLATRLSKFEALKASPLLARRCARLHRSTTREAWNCRSSDGRTADSSTISAHWQLGREQNYRQQHAELCHSVHSEPRWEEMVLVGRESHKNSTSLHSFSHHVDGYLEANAMLFV